MLPYRDPGLGLLDECGAGGEGISPVGRAHRGGEGAVADLHGPGAVGHGERDHVEAIGHVGSDLGQDVGGRGMSLVVEPQDAAPMVVIADVAREGDDRTRPGIVHEAGELTG